jgi:hypothetical protein
MDHSLDIRIPLPREHGAWAMLVVPLLVGISAAETFSAAFFLLAFTAFGFFLMRYPLTLAIKSRTADARAAALRWSAIYGAITFVGGAALWIATRLWLLLPLGALGLASLVLYLLLVARRAEMTTLGEWIGIAGLALGAPGAYLVATRVLNETAFALYALNVLYFGGTVSYIKFKVREQPRLGTPGAGLAARLWAGRATIGYHALVVVVVVLSAFIGWVPLLIPLAFVLPMCKVVAGVATRPARLNIPRLGFVELGFTVAFALIVLLAYR